MVTKQDIFKVKGCESTRKRIINSLLSEYSFLNKRTLGKSRLNRPIEGLSIGNEDEFVLFCGAFHGMEWITSMLLLKYVHAICNAVQTGTLFTGLNISRFLSRRGVVIIPCINPDGVEIAINGWETAGEYKDMVKGICINTQNAKQWQANAAGVDINHNFDAGWDNLHRREQLLGITAPSKTRYGGIAPESEPESKALCDFCRKNNVRHALAFHSQGEEIYWDYGKQTPKRSRLMADIFSQTSGYEVSTPQGIAIGGGFKDWFIQQFHRPAFTIEVGKGKNPLPIDDLPSIYMALEEMLGLATIM